MAIGIRPTGRGIMPIYEGGTWEGITVDLKRRGKRRLLPPLWFQTGSHYNASLILERMPQQVWPEAVRVFLDDPNGKVEGQQYVTLDTAEKRLVTPVALGRVKRSGPHTVRLVLSNARKLDGSSEAHEFTIGYFQAVAQETLTIALASGFLGVVLGAAMAFLVQRLFGG